MRRIALLAAGGEGARGLSRLGFFRGGRICRLLAILLPVSAASCSPVQILNAAAPRAGISAATGIAYAAKPERDLDVYAPAHACDAPVVVFFYGGSWQSGNRAMYRFVGAALAARGVVAIIPDYRLYPEVKFPAFMQDAAAAVAWSRANAGRYGGDPRHLFLMGHSAGAQIATLLALDPRYLQAAGLDRDAIGGVIGLSGPYDFLPLTDPALQTIFGPPAAWPASQPINFVTPRAPPMLLAAGTADRTVDPGNTLRLAARLRQAGVPVVEKHYPGIGHDMTIGAFATLLAWRAPSRRDAMQFIFARHAATAACR